MHPPAKTVPTPKRIAACDIVEVQQRLGTEPDPPEQAEDCKPDHRHHNQDPQTKHFAAILHHQHFAECRCAAQIAFLKKKAKQKSYGDCCQNPQA